MRKILFLDIDGVCNCNTTPQRSTRGFIGIDPYMAFLVGKIQLDTGCDVVLSSSWRHSPEGVEEIEKSVVKIFDKTGSSSSGLRGVEIYQWINSNIPPDQKNDMKYAILDDESDMLLWQKDHFFQTSWQTGITEEIAKKVIKHLNEDDECPCECHFISVTGCGCNCKLR